VGHAGAAILAGVEMAGLVQRQLPRPSARQSY